MNKIKQKKQVVRSLTLIVCTFLIATSFFSVALSFSSNLGASAQGVQYSFSFKKPDLKRIELYGEVFTGLDMPGTFSIGSKPGTPVYQVLPTKILIPSGKRVVDIRVIPNSLLEVTSYSPQIDLLQQPIAPYQPAIPIGQPAPESIIFDENIYQTNQKLPDDLYESLGVHQCRGYSILTLNIYPTKYNPVEGKLWYFDEIIIDIDLEDETSSNNMFRNNIMDKQWVQSLVTNPEQIESYSISSFSNSLDYPGGLCDSTESYDYVIITRDVLSDFSGTNYTWTDFINKKQADGLQTTLVTVEEIEACQDYWNDASLFNDTPALIREFLKDAYEDWGLTYVLIAGDVTGAAGIERRLMSSSVESNIEAEIYWSNLDNTFNDDGDTSWGEEGDAGFDLYSELFIGSVPCDEGIDVSNWMTKSFYYADSTEKDYLENAGFYGGNTGWSCEGDDFIDFTIYGTDNYMGPDPNSDGPWPDFLGFLQGFDTWNASNPGYEYNTSVMWTAEPPNPGGWQGGSESAAVEGLKNDISNDLVTILNGVAHANADMSCDVGSSSWESDYHNTKPFFIHDYGCHCGEMSGADDGVLHSMLFHSDIELAFACVYNTGYGWGNYDSTNSSSALQQKLFWEYCFNLSESGGSDNWQLAKAQQYAKDTLAPTIDWEGSFRENIQCSTLFGDPAQLLKIPFVPEHDIMVTSLTVDAVVPHNETQIVSATVRNVGNNTETNIVVNFTATNISLKDTVINTTIIPSIESMESVVVSFNWDPPIGDYLVSIESDEIFEEYDLNNNFVNQTVSVVAAPAIEVTPLSLNFMLPTEATDTDEITITNLATAEAILHYNISFAGDLDGSWLASNPENGIISIDDSDLVMITVNSTGLDEGIYHGYVIIESDDVNDPEIIVVIDMTVVYGKDMAAISVNSPVGIVVYGSYIINATVQNLGYYPQTDVIVNCSIYDGGIGGTILDEDFSTDPYGEWTITHNDGTAWTWDSGDERMENTYGYPSAGYLDSPALDCSGKTGISLSFWHYWKADYSSGNQDGYVRGSIDGGATFPYLIDSFHHNNPAEETAVKNYDISSWANNQAQVVIRFDIYNNNDWYWRIDDFNVNAEITGPLVYSSETMVNITNYESQFVEFSPAWDAVMGTYGIQITTLLPGDEHLGNDVTADVVFVEGPALSFDPTSYNAGTMMVNTSDSTTFDIWNDGVGTLTYTLSETCSWIDLSSYGGDSTGEHDTITVDVNTTGLTAGVSYHYDIGISSDGGPGVFGVDVYVVDDTTPIEDVNQSVFDRGFPIRHAVDGDWAGAQNFTPTMSSIAGVDLYLRKFGTPEFDLVVELREDGPEGVLVDTVTYTPSEIPSSWGWFNVDFTDTPVTPGTDYFIVLPPAPSGVTTSFGYEWGYAFGDLYGSGGFWFTRDGGTLWRDLPTMYEFTFKTYGLI